MRERSKSHETFILKQRLIELLHHRSWTAAELSRRSGVPRQVLSLWLSGVEPRKLSHLKSVATTLGMSIDELCFKSDRITRDQDWIEGIFEGRVLLRKTPKGE